MASGSCACAALCPGRSRREGLAHLDSCSTSVRKLCFTTAHSRSASCGGQRRVSPGPTASRWPPSLSLSLGRTTHLLEPLHCIRGVPEHSSVHTAEATLANSQLGREVAGAAGDLTEGPAEGAGPGPLQQGPHAGLRPATWLEEVAGASCPPRLPPGRHRPSGEGGTYLGGGRGRRRGQRLRRLLRGSGARAVPRVGRGSWRGFTEAPVRARRAEPRAPPLCRPGPLPGEGTVEAEDGHFRGPGAGALVGARPLSPALGGGRGAGGCPVATGGKEGEATGIQPGDWGARGIGSEVRNAGSGSLGCGVRGPGARARAHRRR